LREKLILYDEAAMSARLPPNRPVLLPDGAAGIVRSNGLESARLTVATGTLERHLADPLGANWLPVRHDRRPKTGRRAGSSTTPASATSQPRPS
jgi:hypothetical protein